jgi:hypothetical protein
MLTAFSKSQHPCNSENNLIPSNNFSITISKVLIMKGYSLIDSLEEELIIDQS